MKKPKKGDKKPIYAIIYVRTATEGEESTSNIEQQLRECKQFAKKRGLVFEEGLIYRDTNAETETGAGLHNILQMVTDTPERTYLLVVADKSRIARTYEQYDSYSSALASKGVVIESVKGAGDLNPEEVLKQAVEYAFNRYEYSIRRYKAMNAIRQKVGK